jgi:hypothetical protein
MAPAVDPTFWHFALLLVAALCLAALIDNGPRLKGG